MRLLLIICSLALCSFLALYLFKFQNSPLPFFSPLASATVSASLISDPQVKQYGFLPYWLLSTGLDSLLSSTLTDVIYFSLSLDETGHLVTSDTAYRHLPFITQNLPHQYNLHLAITPLSSQALEAILASESARVQATKTITQVVQTYRPFGINIDFEPPSASPQLAQSFNTFITGLVQNFNTMSPSPILTIDVYANAARVENMWDIPFLASQPLQLVVMGYDYHRQSSSLAGPIGPIHNPDGESLSSHLFAFTKHVKPSQLILGVPLYGYQWQITDAQSKHTYPKSAKAIYLKDIPSLLARFNAQTFWDPTSLSPYATFTNQEKQYYLAFENPQSLSYKRSLATQLQLAGVAYWALGYVPATHPFWSN
jgi:spore germination protein YaaH